MDVELKERIKAALLSILRGLDNDQFATTNYVVNRLAAQGFDLGIGTQAQAFDAAYAEINAEEGIVAGRGKRGDQTLYCIALKSKISGDPRGRAFRYVNAPPPRRIHPGILSSN